MTLPNIGWVAGDEWRQVYAKQPEHKDIYVHRFIFYVSNPDTHHLTTLLKQKIQLYILLLMKQINYKCIKH